MAKPTETPQEFIFETKFVVLNYLGILPSYDDIGDESELESSEEIIEEEEEEIKSYGLLSPSHSRDSSLDNSLSSRDSDELRRIRGIVASSLAMPSADAPAMATGDLGREVYSSDALQDALIGQGTEKTASHVMRQTSFGEKTSDIVVESSHGKKSSTVVIETTEREKISVPPESPEGGDTSSVILETMQREKISLGSTETFEGENKSSVILETSKSEKLSLSPSETSEKISFATSKSDKISLVAVETQAGDIHVQAKGAGTSEDENSLVADADEASPRKKTAVGMGIGDTSEDMLEGFRLPSDVVRDTYISRESSRSHSSDKSLSPTRSSHPPALKVSMSTESTRHRRVSKKKRKDALHDMASKDKMQMVLEELESHYKREMTEEGVNSSQVLCAISREAQVAARIAYIGDLIMQHHQDEFDDAFRQIIGAERGSLNYGIFKSAVKSVVKNNVPGWYHVAVMMKFTRKMAVSVLDQGSRGVAAITNYASRYIEENLAQSIIEQGGWDALTNVDVDKIDSETWSEMSSGTPSPFSGSSPPIEMHTDESGHLMPFRRPSGQAQLIDDEVSSDGDATMSREQSMVGLNDIGNEGIERPSVIAIPVVRDESDSAVSSSMRFIHPTMEGGALDLESPGTRRRRIQSERVPEPERMDDEDLSPRTRAASTGATGTIIATAATAAAAAAAAAIGAYALMKK